MVEGKKIAAIVLAAGRGSRMNSDIPKQFICVNGYPLLYYSLKAFEDSVVDEVVLVTEEGSVGFCQTNFVEKYHFKKVISVVPGGSERFLSVYEGLKNCPLADYVLIHDGARPMLSVETIAKMAKAVVEYPSCAMAVRAKDTIKIADETEYVKETPDRNVVWQMQTPQGFSSSIIRKAYERLFLMEPKNWPSITDDAMLVETFAKEKVKLVEGEYRNIKVTTAEDLDIARVFLKK